ncbi:unnamed protein product [Polarella glacialis]|uniref:GATA-type domain-containing protein n=1 Tax=Polarella glacialis TaxID=89957 RepID=A0A813FX41_POLGL|nr:unnamed protein product [Polarella glacialis]
MPIEVDILTLTNAFRKEHALPALRLHQDLSRVATTHAANVADGIEPFSHLGAPERFVSSGARCLNVAENLARSDGFGREEIPRAAVSGWCGSEGHRRNLLGPFDACGIGWAANDAGVIFVTQLLALIDEREGPNLRAQAAQVLKEGGLRFLSSTPAVCATVGLALGGPMLMLGGGVVGGALSLGVGLRPATLPRAACHRALTWYRPSECACCGAVDCELWLSPDDRTPLCTSCHPSPADARVWQFVD